MQMIQGRAGARMGKQQWLLITLCGECVVYGWLKQPHRALVRLISLWGWVHEFNQGTLWVRVRSVCAHLALLESGVGEPATPPTPDSNWARLRLRPLKRATKHTHTPTDTA